MFGRFNGVVFVFSLFLTSLLGTVFLIVPFLPFARFAPLIFRTAVDRLVGYWLTFPASMCEWVLGIRFHVRGDLIDRDQPALIIMNHRTRLDWLFMWNALYKMDPWLLTTEKISLKAPLKQIPGAGWAMACGGYIFLQRNFEADKELIREMLEYYKEMGMNYQLLLFPEGTDRGERAARLSHQYADKNRLKRYDYCLHPRTTGFTYLIDLMRDSNYLSCVYDVTVGYADHVLESEMALLKEGRFPRHIHFEIERHDASELPREKEALGDWLTVLWEGKEERLRSFYEEKKGEERRLDRRIGGERGEWPIETTGVGYSVAFGFWLVAATLWTYLIITSTWIKVYVVCAIAFYVWALRCHGGVELLVLKWYHQWAEQRRRVESSKAQ